MSVDSCVVFEGSEVEIGIQNDALHAKDCATKRNCEVRHSIGGVDNNLYIRQDNRLQVKESHNIDSVIQNPCRPVLSPWYKRTDV